MIKRFCDCCGKEMYPENTPHSGSSGGRLQAELSGGRAKLTVEVLTKKDGVSNAGDFCTHCILDALYQLDDRPKEPQ